MTGTRLHRAGGRLGARLAFAVLPALAACSAAQQLSLAGDLSASVTDLGSPGPVVDGGVGGSYAQVGFSGCPRIGGDGGTPRCSGPAPLTVTLVPLTSPGTTTGILWSTSDGGAPPSSKLSSPLVTFAMPGHYPTRLVVGFGSSQATGSALIEVSSAATGGACAVDAQCGGGDGCRCSPPLTDAGVACPSELTAGLCTRACTGGSCGAGQLCADLSRSALDAPDRRDDPYRQPLCLPSCNSGSDCRPGFQCRELPVLADGAAGGGAFTWRRACFAPLLWDVGHPCSDGNGAPAPAVCLGGACASMGARNLCTSACADRQRAPCPSATGCATFGFAPSAPICLPECDQAHPCSDPLFDCQAPRPGGYFGFTVVNGNSPTYCAPRRCSADVDCMPAGRCRTPDGGPDGGQPADGGPGPDRFCVR